MSNYELQVKQQVEKLSSCSYHEIETAVAAKRISWYRQQAFDSRSGHAATPREAFERLFFDYMGLAPKDLPIIHETEDKIVWQSKNACPTLDACLRLGLDTRKVCRAAYEKSTQAFLSQIDPQLRFLRSYQEIRPYAGHCLESIVKIDFEQIMRIAIAEARISRMEGNKGYGAVIVYGQQILSKTYDTATTENDPSLHAEVKAIREAVQVTGDANLSGAVLFSTCEPCPMCSALAVWANVTSVVYGASIEETAKLGKARIMISSQTMVEKSPVMIEVIGNVLGQECTNLYR
ncbi:MAG: nucleoside deaminase [Chloroflexi bacterium]|nr:MAG: nucleoside deaminase [Chloroflexota bacterium]